MSNLLKSLVLVLLMASCISTQTKSKSKVLDYNSLCLRHGMFIDYKYVGREFRYTCRDGHKGVLKI